jgi:hypothetical protein
MDQDARAFNDELRRAARANRFVIEAEQPNSLAQAIDAYTDARARNDELAAEAAEHDVRRLVAEQDAAKRTPPPDFGAGARPVRQEPPDMNTILRSARTGGY